MASPTSKSLGWGNQPRVVLHNTGLFVAPDLTPIDGAAQPREASLQQGDGLYRMAAIVDDQTGNPFLEARVSLAFLRAATDNLTKLLGNAGNVGLADRQRLQLLASGSVVLLSIAESQAQRKSREGALLVRQCMDFYLKLLEGESNALLAERMAINLDWILPSLPSDLSARARSASRAWIPDAPPYAAWFANGSNVLRIDWKCGGEFLSGWKRRLQEEKFVLVTDGGEFSDSELKRVIEVGTLRTEVQLIIGPERNNVFRKMGDPAVHLVGYDGHSDWGRKIPRSLENAPAAAGDKVIMYLLCCGKQVLQRVKDTYPRAALITTFNSSKFTQDFRYSEDFSAFIHVLEGISRRESWAQIRDRVNKDWYNNPESNYLFPNEPLLMARSLDRDHDGQADMFDKLIDFNTFDVKTDARQEFTPRVPETPPSQIVGTRLHFGVQVFHTLAHFNQVLEPFTHDLRVFAAGWYDPTQAPAEGVVERGPTRVVVEKQDGKLLYRFSGSCHFAHATEEAWRVMATLALTPVVLKTEPSFKNVSAEQRAMTALLMVAQGLEVDDAWGRDGELWRNLLPRLGLPEGLPLELFQSAKKANEHWYAGSRTSFDVLTQGLKPELLAALKGWGA